MTVPDAGTGNRTDVIVLPGVPPINHNEHPDLFLEALSIAASYGNEDLAKRFPMGVYPHLSGYTGRAWRIGFDEACFAWEKHGIRNPNVDFAASGLETNCELHETMGQAVAHLGCTPEFLWNVDSRYRADAALAAPFVSTARVVDCTAVRRYVTDYLTTRRQPLVCFLRCPDGSVVDAALLTGFRSGGEVVVGNSPHRGHDAPAGGPGQRGGFCLADWERDVVAIVGLRPEAPPEPQHHPCYTAIENALRYATNATRGTRHYGLSAYDAWERALLDEESITRADDGVLSRRLLYHSAVAGHIACQKAFTAFPDYWNAVPAMGVISGLLQRAVAGPQIIHGLMWDVWQVVGGYWRGVKPGGDSFRHRWDNEGEVRRFRDRAVRERAAAVVRRARKVDEQALAELREAREEWDACRGQGASHPCPCWEKPCARV